MRILKSNIYLTHIFSYCEETGHPLIMGWLISSMSNYDNDNLRCNVENNILCHDDHNNHILQCHSLKVTYTENVFSRCFHEIFCYRLCEMFLVMMMFCPVGWEWLVRGRDQLWLMGLSISAWPHISSLQIVEREISVYYLLISYFIVSTIRSVLSYPNCLVPMTRPSYLSCPPVSHQTEDAKWREERKIKNVAN